ncbi:MAG: YihY/virulence factor BrkB family protein [Anaerolineae bacterium]
MSRIREVIRFFQEVLQEWNSDKAPRLAAALAYYTVFSIAPLLIVVIAVAGIAFGQEAVRGQLDDQIRHLVGAEGATLIQEMVASSSRPNDSFVASIIGIVTLLLGAGGVFGQLQDALNTAWDVEPKPSKGGILPLLKARFISFSMVLGVGFLLLVSLVLSAVLSAVTTSFSSAVPGDTSIVLQIVNQILSFGVITVLFAMIFKFLPDTEIKWRDVWVGAAFTAILFSIGKYLIGLYLGSSGVASSYGAAGSLIIILLWIFYSAQILLLGAEFTQVWARRYGSHQGRRPAPTPGSVSTAPRTLAAVVPLTDRQRRATNELNPQEFPVVYTPRISIQQREAREQTLLTAGLISYVVALVGVVVVLVRKTRQ